MSEEQAPYEVKIRAAHATDRDNFCLILYDTDYDYDEPFSIVLLYDALTPKQPWSRYDVPRLISDVEFITNVDNTETFIDLSDEGDIYRFEGDKAAHSKIEGAGLYSEDSKGYGAMNEILNLEGALLAVGLAQQLYMKEMDSWEKIEDPIFQPEGDVENIHFNAIGGRSKDHLHVVGIESMKSVQHNIPQKLLDERLAAKRADDREWFRRVQVKIREHRTPLPKRKGRAFHFNKGTWSEIDVEDQFPETVFIDSKDQVWFGGAGNSTLIKLDEDHEIDPIEIDPEGRGSIYSITEFKDRLILANDFGLFAYNENYDSLEDEIVRIKPKLNKKLHTKPSPLKVQAVDDVMYYFDYNLGIYIWDGDKTWTNIPIPPELLEREFKGLKSEN